MVVPERPAQASRLLAKNEGRQRRCLTARWWPGKKAAPRSRDSPSVRVCTTLRRATARCRHKHWALRKPNNQQLLISCCLAAA